MAIIRWIFTGLGALAFALAFVSFAVKRRAVCFPRWLRCSYLGLLSVIYFCLAGMFVSGGGIVMIALRAVGAVLSVVAAIIAAYLNVFGLRLYSGGFVVVTLLSRRVYTFGDITAVNAKIERGLTFVRLKVGGRKIAIYRMMSGYEEFCLRLEGEKVFAKFPIVK